MFVIGDGHGPLRRRHLALNSVPKVGDTELYLCPPAQLLVLTAWDGSQRVDWAAPEALIETAFEQHIDKACPQRQRLGVIRPMPKPGCCWVYVPDAAGAPAAPAAPSAPAAPASGR